MDHTLLSGWVAVPVLNLSPHALRDLRFRTPANSAFRVDALAAQAQLVRALEDLDSFAPGVLSFVPLRLRAASPASSAPARCPGAFKLTLTASYASGGAAGTGGASQLKQLESNSISIHLRCSQ